VDLLEAVENGPQEFLVMLRVTHVVDGQDDDGLDVFLADPLRGNELREGARGIIGIKFVEIGETVTLARLGVGRGGQKEQKQGKDQASHGRFLSSGTFERSPVRADSLTRPRLDGGRPARKHNPEKKSTQNLV